MYIMFTAINGVWRWTQVVGSAGTYSCGFFDGVKNVTVHLLNNFNQLQVVGGWGRESSQLANELARLSVCMTHFLVGHFFHSCFLFHHFRYLVGQQVSNCLSLFCQVSRFFQQLRPNLHQTSIGTCTASKKYVT